MLRIAAVVVAGLVAGPCLAQSDLEGNWTATYATPTGVQREARVSIKGEEGTWKMATARTNREDPCPALAVPFTISKTEEVYAFAMSPSKAMAGCGSDYTLRVRKVDDKTMKGNFRDGREYVLSRN
ncbi:hypothetical protein QTH90_10860 [Variovorax sp. J2P1-59]|uniref:hypothetical protein n=1 Tax=Variovorax flavidus TaxID=3053501 RepID=UPI002574FD16|nr:hypothetical protein [Variovorax sp. J2P1-59]MDM0074883.1 hypothetical protein [Variovorax sp. J2P1-59]